MAVYVVTGKLGSGKSLVAVSRILDYLKRGRRVATNMDLRMEHLCRRGSKSTVYRLPDVPNGEDLAAMGEGYEGKYDESKFGLVVLDEAAKWLNSRQWSDKARVSLLDWCIHARKLGWDVYLLVQSIEVLDKQVVELIAEHVVVCRRLDRLKVPLLGRVLPRVHIGTVWYGQSPAARQSFKVARWWYRGTGLFQAYDTRQVFGPVKEAHTLLGPHWLAPVPRRDYVSEAAQLVVQCIAYSACHLTAWKRRCAPELVAREWRLLKPPADTGRALVVAAHSPSASGAAATAT